MNDCPADEELMRRLAQDDPTALDGLMQRYEGSVLNMIYWSIGDRHRAQEIAQDVFVAVYHQRARYRARAKFSTWLFRIVRNRCLNELRDRASAQRHVVQMPEGLEELPERRDAAPDAQAEQAERQEELIDALAALPENQRTAFVLAKIEGLSYREIAERMEITLSACESLVHRARLTLREKLRALINPAEGAQVFPGSRVYNKDDEK